ncbi:hypothetical protein [Methylotuvimicrobium sp. KM2]|uniref:hypothetical protein n=1 Tax=Methylotuvimicrobium sp. KM2 TaxID=3133976 RepID=UPI003100B148
MISIRILYETIAYNASNKTKPGVLCYAASARRYGKTCRKRKQLPELGIESGRVSECQVLLRPYRPASRKLVETADWLYHFVLIRTF